MELSKNQIAARKRWEGISLENRSKRMSKIATIKNKNMTVEEKHAQALKMVKARKYRPVRVSLK